MYYYWAENSFGIKLMIESLIANCDTIKDSKKDYDSKKYDKYLKIGSGFDTETSIIQLAKIESAYVYHWQFSLTKRLIVMGRSLDEFEEFIDFLIDAIPKGYKLLTLVANLGYDYYFSKRRLVKYKIDKHFEKSVRNPLVIEVGGKIVLREVIGLFGRSLEQIAKNYTKTQKSKGDLDYSLTRLSKTPLTDVEIGYCVNDVKILAELGDYIFDNYFGKNMTLPLTATSELRMMVKKAMGQNQLSIRNEMQDWMPDDEEEYYLFRHWMFKGGLCGTNSLHMNKHLKNVGHADFDSHYPACMNHFLYPMGKPVRVPRERFMSENKPYIAVITFVDFKSKTTHSIMSSHKAYDITRKELDDTENFTIDNGRIWKAKKVTFVVNDVEFKSICKAYDFNKKETFIKYCWEFPKYGRLPYYILDILNEHYRKKTELKKKGLDKTLDYQFAKSLVNAIFGMLCTALYTDEYVIDEITGEIFPKIDDAGNRVKKDYDKALKSIFMSPFWGMWVTSYARSLLTDFIVKFPNCIIQYDTDSIFFRTDMKESKRLLQYIKKYNEDCIALNNLIFNNDQFFKKLGTFEVDEDLMTDFKGLGSKRYMFRQLNRKTNSYQIETVVAGCRKGTIIDQFVFDTKLDPEMNIDEVFDYFKDGLKVDKEHSKKLSSKYVSDYDGKEVIEVTAFDYNNKPEIIKLESAILLRPIEFNMGLSETHTKFYMTIQKAYENAPASMCKMFESIVNTFELLPDTDE